MEVLKIYSKRSFWVITVLAVLIAGCLDVGLYFGVDWILNNFSRGIAQETVLKNVSEIIGYIEQASPYIYKGMMPVVAGVVLVMGWLLWLILKISISWAFKSIEQVEGETSGSVKEKKDFVDQRVEQDRKRRVFLHSLSVLQREGRLLDFFDEDLSLYEDDQIGAAVRSIQEDCKKTVKKYIDPKPVLGQEEGDPVVIEAGFDVDSIKLVGNISGNPPFEGVLRHRGWKSGKKEIPKLSDVQDSTVITPAEVEIQ